MDIVKFATQNCDFCNETIICLSCKKILIYEAMKDGTYDGIIDSNLGDGVEELIKKGITYTNKTNWIKIEDRKPPNDVRVFVATYDGRPKVNMYFTQIASRMNNEWLDDQNEEKLDSKYGIVTHWMPLPDPPEKPNE